MLTTVFEIRKKIIEAYGQYEYIIIPALKFCVAFLLILEIDSHIGFNLGLTNTLLGVIIALICSLVPVNFIAGILMVLVLAHLYTLSLETAAGVYMPHRVYCSDHRGPSLYARKRGRRSFRRDHHQVSDLCRAEQGGFGQQ